jgi:hypothetical protein
MLRVRDEESPFPLPFWGQLADGILLPSPCLTPASTCPPTSHLSLSPLPPDSIPDGMGPKMLEELKSRLDSLAQEVALLKEQQALQTGEYRHGFWAPACLGGRHQAHGPLASSRS